MRDKKAMAATYTPVSLEDMEKFLMRSFRVLRPKKTTFRGEICYEMTVSKATGIRVMTSIGAGRDTGASVGEDAIRVAFISLKDGGPLTSKNGKLPIVKRTQNWRDSLKDRIDDYLDKYEESEEFWDEWATNRNRKGDPEKAIHQQEVEELHEEREHAKDEDGEGSEGRPASPPPQPPAAPKTQYDPSRMQGGITDPQMNFLRLLMRGMTQDRWESSGAASITGIPDSPKSPSQVRGLSKGQASRLIDALKKSSGGRFAAEDRTATDKWKV